MNYQGNLTTIRAEYAGAVVHTATVMECCDPADYAFRIEEAEIEAYVLWPGSSVTVSETQE